MWRSYLDCSYSELITSGCDSRLAPKADGLNRYGCSALPRRELALGSCSCSTPTALGVKASEALVAQLRRSQTSKWIVANAIDEIRSRFREMLAIGPDADIALTPSGTDAELLALALSDRDESRPITNIVVGPGEVGSGTLRAAGGLHYDNVVPRGNAVRAGSPVDKPLAKRVQTETISLRNRRGEIRSIAEIDAEINESVVAAVEQGRQVLLHAVAHSKTGVYAPRLETLRSISQNLGDDVTVIVDAAQGRLGDFFGTVDYQTLLDLGFLVSMTGSKFFGGPPFSAALIVPHTFGVADRTRGLPESFGQYFTRAEMPRSWHAIRHSMDSWINIPALVRWTASIAQMAAFFDVPSAHAEAIHRVFHDAAVDSLNAQPGFAVMDSFDSGASDWHVSPAEALPTVVSFAVRGDRGYLAIDQLRELHKRLNHSPELPIQLGQPVVIAPTVAVLRMALGASLMTQVSSDETLGESFETRVAWLWDQIEMVGDELQRMRAAPIPQMEARLV